jgi:HEAT repeat protein/Na+/melibiose symporter-like transporter
MATPNRFQLLRNLRITNFDVAFASAFGNLVAGGVLISFIKYLNGSDLWIGVLSAIPSTIGILQIPGAIWGRSKVSYKKFVLWGTLGWRAFYLPFIVLPFLPIDASEKLALAATCAIASAVCVFISNPIYNDWLAEMVPETSRGVFFSKRNAIGTAVGSTAGIIGGIILDRAGQMHRHNEGYSIVFSLGIIAAAISFSFFMQMQDLERENPIQQNLFTGLKAFGAPFSDKAYRKVLIYLGCAVIGQGFPGSLYFAYGLESIHLPITVLQLAGACQALGTVLSSRFWGFASDKYGNKPMLAIAGLALAINPIPWLLLRPNQLVFNTILLLNAHIFFGILWGGVNLCQFNLMLSTAKPEDRANYLGAGMATTALIGGLAPMAGATVMAWLRISRGALGAYSLVFITTSILRVLATTSLWRVREAGSTEVRTALQHLAEATPGRVRALRKLTRSSKVEEREAALEELGDTSFTMAADEMVKALHDPLPRVRRQAAQALSRLRDAESRGRATETLIEQLDAHPDFVEEETIDVLGELADARALKVLVPMLKSPRSLVRRAASRALGRLGEMDAVPALIEAVGAVDDPDLRRTSLQALRRLEAREAWPVFAECVLDSRASIRIAAADAIAELEIGEAAEALRQSLRDYPDVSASEVAYALGVVGEFSDVPVVLQAIGPVAGSLTGRQGLLGVARLLGVEREVYRLMLLEGMERDTVIVETLKQSARNSNRIRVALQSYSSGDEDGAIRGLASGISHPGLKELARHPVPGAFLVAVAVAAQASARR